MSRWDKHPEPYRRYNPLNKETILLGLVVFTVISLGFMVFGGK